MPQLTDGLQKLQPLLKIAAPILQKRAAEWAAEALNDRRQKRLLSADEPVLAPAEIAVRPPPERSGRSPVLVVAGMIVGVMAGVAAGIMLFGRRT